MMRCSRCVEIRVPLVSTWCFCDVFVVDRVDSTRWGPRAVDVDILMYDELVLDGKSVEVYSNKLVCR